MTLAALVACSISDPSDPHRDVVALAVLLVVGENEARMLAVHPHREPGDDPPEITASLDGPGWQAAFSETPGLADCNDLLPGPFPSRCLSAALPEAIQPSGAYRIGGTAPLGSFTGEVTMPDLPHLVEPTDTMRLPVPAEPGWVDIPMRYQVGPDIGTLLADVTDVFETQEDGSEKAIPPDQFGFPQDVHVTGADTISIYHDGKPLRFSLRLLGLGWHYTDFVRHWEIQTLLLPPWPNFGIMGQGVYGYLDGIAPSRVARILVR